MTALWTIEETLAADHAKAALELAADTMAIEKRRQHLNRHCWDRKDSRERIRKSLSHSVDACQLLLRKMKATAAKELGQ